MREAEFSQTNPTPLRGLFEGIAARCSALASLARLRAELAIDGQGAIRRTASLFGAFCSFLLGGRQPVCVQKSKNPSKVQGCPMRSSSAGAEMLADKEKSAENTLCILKGFDAV